MKDSLLEKDNIKLMDGDTQLVLIYVHAVNMGVAKANLSFLQ
jgi:hypothetical protein